MKNLLKTFIFVFAFVFATSTFALEYKQTLRAGIQGNDVISLQQVLKDRGYYRLSVDGKYGPATVRAVAAFQQANGLSADGVAGPNTYTHLASDSALSLSNNSANTGSNTSADVSATLSPLASATVANSVTVNADSACTKIYEPVCGQPMHIECVMAPCPQPNPVTYGNICTMKAQNATFLYKGTCKQAPVNDTTASAESATSVSSSSGAVPTLSAGIGMNISAGAVPTLRVGTRHDAVINVQNTLKRLGYYNATVDGHYGNMTSSAVRSYQRAKGLSADGVVGIKTYAHIQADANAEAMTSVSSTGAVLVR